MNSRHRSNGTGVRSPGLDWESARGVLPAILVLLLATVVRVLAARNDLWLDEIWSLQIAQSARSSIEIFTGQHLDNNHCLNTWLMRLLSGVGPDWILRVPALAAGVATVLVSGWIGGHIAGRAGLLSALVVCGGSYMLIHYGSEARGYAFAGFFALTAWYALLRGLALRGWSWPFVFWCATALGLLSHATFIPEAYAGLFVWSVYRLAGKRGSWRGTAAHVARWHVVPLLTLLAYYLVRLRFMEFGGGPPFTWQFVLGRLSAFTVGWPAGDGATGAAIVVVIIVLLAASWALWRQRSDLWVLLVANCLVCPAAFLLLRQPERLFERYFFISVTFFTIFLAGLVASGIRHGRTSRVVSLAVVVVFLAGNAVHTSRLVRFGRGQYVAALEHIAAQSDPADGAVPVSSDNDFRNGTLVRHHARHLTGSRTITYVAAAEASGAGVDWMIMHTRDAAYPPETVLEAGERGQYRFDRAYPSAPMSGFYWNLFRLTPSPGGAVIGG